MNLLKRKQDECDFEYKLRLCLMKLDKETDLDWIEIVNLLGLNVSSDHLRKISYGFFEYHEYIKNKAIKNTDKAFFNELEEKIREIKLERYKLQTEKVENNRWHRELARIDLWEEKMANIAKNTIPIQVPEIKLVNTNNKKIGVLGIADTHFGKLVDIKGLMGETLNFFNEDVFQDRMWYILSEVKHIVNKEQLTKIDLYLLGDLIDGMLRQSQLRSLQYGITDSVVKFGEFIATWLNELSKLCELEVFTSMGNHSEIRPLNSKAGDFPHENVEKLIIWFVQSRLRDNKNIKIHDAKFINYKNTLGVNILATHGQKDKNLENSIKGYTALYNVDVDILLTGHKHCGEGKSTGISKTFGNVEYIQFPSICGIDDFSMMLKRSALPGTNMLIIEEGKGKTVTYDININNKNIR